ncbi:MULTISPECIES: cypemycin family RiPP [unclassified Kitasatospora]|uniref:cypemycin family RiPP n=1 Tax=unclassified Kitasatospora TaxID=2633591 RepID=UPI003326B869
MNATESRVEFVTDAVNASFAEAQEGFVNAHNAPAMTTPTIVAICEVVVTGSTICLGC